MNQSKLIKIITMLMFVFLSTTLIAQSGPNVPCPDCGDLQYKPLPKSGNWYNPEQSGVGFNFEIQNTTILGYYYGYTEAGDSMWSVFSGKMSKVEDGDALWTITSELMDVSGGQCINCDHQFPTSEEKVGDIELTFNRLGHASYQINDGDSQNIVPMYFGYQPVQSVYNETGAEIVVPEIEGWWVMYWVEADEESQWPKFYRDKYVVYYIYKANKPQQVDASHDLEFRTLNLPEAPESQFGVPIECNYTGDNIIKFNRCSINLLDNTYLIPWSNITGDRIFGEAEDGSTIEFVRVELDVCGTNDIEKCINTRTRFE